MPGPETPAISIVIPALNERENLEKLLPLLRETCAGLNLQSEVIVVDGGSHDGTREVAESLGARVLKQTQRGYGGALMAGFAAAAGTYMVTMDADMSHRPSFLNEFWKSRDRADMLIASRYVPGGSADVSWFRGLLSRILNAVYRRVLDIPVLDLSSGFRMYRRDLLERLELHSRDFDVLEEILIKIYINNGQIFEVPFHYMPRSSGRSHARLFKFGCAYLRTLHSMWGLRRSMAARNQGPAFAPFSLE
jgi:dolichol-phosphate mannosyltransferase